MAKAKYLTVKLANGEKKQLKFYGKTDAEATKKRDEARIKYEAGLLVLNAKTTFAKWKEEWLEVYKKPKVTDSTLDEIEGIIRRVFLPTLGGMKMGDIRLINIQRCINALEGKSESYIHKAYIYIKALFKKAFENDIIAKDPTIGLEEPQGVETEEVRPLSPKEQEIFKAVMVNHPHGPFFGMMLACGLRPQEVRTLTWFNMNLKKGTVTVAQAVQAKSEKIKDPKSKSGKRTIPIPKWYMPILQEKIKRTASPYVFPNELGKPIAPQRYVKYWKSIMRQMDIFAGAELYRNKIIIHALDQNITPYSLRHTYATDLVEKGVHMKAAQYLLGHSDIRTTAKIYVHVTDKIVEDARLKIDAEDMKTDKAADEN